MASAASHRRGKKRPASPAAPDRKVYGRARITNGGHILPGIDGRSVWARRLRDLIDLHVADRGGPEVCSEAEKALIRRCACLITEAERMELRFAQNEGAKPQEIDVYQRMVNSLRRTLEALGIKRDARAINARPEDEPYERFRRYLEAEDA